MKKTNQVSQNSIYYGHVPSEATNNDLAIIDGAVFRYTDNKWKIKDFKPFGYDPETDQMIAKGTIDAAKINLKIGNETYKGFVEGINETLGHKSELEERF